MNSILRAMVRRSPLIVLTFAAILMCISAANAAIDLTLFGSAVTQDFNTLAASGTTNAITTVPTDWTFVESGTGANTTYAAGTGSDNTGNTYSFGSAGSADRALGGG